MKLREGLIFILISALAIAAGCDRRSSTSRSKETVSFSVDMTVVRDLSTGYNSVDITFNRNNQPFSGATITVNTSEVPNGGGGIYYVNDPFFDVLEGINEITFESPDDNYMKTVTISMPGDFLISEVSPRLNINVDDVFVSWHASASATKYLLVVATVDYGVDGTTPYFANIPTGTSATVPDSVFYDDIDEVVNGIYYIYVIAYNDGLGPFIRQGTEIPMPDNLPVRFLSDPSGFARYGTVAPIDSIIVDVLLSN